MRFELTDLWQSAVFKTAAINRTLPHFHIKTHSQWLSMPTVGIIVLPRSSLCIAISFWHNFLRNLKPHKMTEMCFYMAGVVGFEPTILISKTSALGQTRRYPYFFWLYKFLKNKCVLYQNQTFCQPLCCFETTNKKPRLFRVWVLCLESLLILLLYSRYLFIYTKPSR